MTALYLIGNEEACRVSAYSKEKMVSLALEQFGNTEKEYYYGITHYYLIEKYVRYFKTNIAPETLHALIAFVEFNASDYEEGWSMGDETVLKIINKYFGKITYLDEEPKEYYYIDQYFNWEFFCGSGVENKDEFLLEGIVNDIHEAIKAEIEEWDNKKSSEGGMNNE